MSAQFVIEPLSDKHDRQDFSCGNPVLDRYLQTQAAKTPDGVSPIALSR